VCDSFLKFHLNLTWYYNTTLSIVYKHYGFENILKKNKYSDKTVRDLIRRYEYTAPLFQINHLEIKIDLLNVCHSKRSFKTL